MHDDQLRNLLRTLEDPRDPDPAFADALFNRLGMVAKNERHNRTPFIVLAAAVLLVALMAGVAIGSGLIELPFTADASPTPSASTPAESGSPAASASEAPSPTPASELAFEAPPGVLPQFAIVVVNESLQLRAASSAESEVVAEVESGTRMMITGPLLVDGERWYTLSSLGPTDLVSGKVAMNPTGGEVELEPVVCPTEEPSLVIVAALNPWERLACYGNREIVFEGYEVVGFGGFVPGVHTPEWLNGTFGALAVADPDDPSSSVFVHAAPEYVDLTRPQPTTEIGDALLRVTGHFSDDAAAACSSTDIPIGPDPDGAVADIEPIASELFCRGQFVVTDFEVLDEGSGGAPVLDLPAGLLPAGSLVIATADGLRIRDAPTTEAPVVANVRTGDALFVVDSIVAGPVAADGYHWYEVEYADGREVWPWQDVAPAGTQRGWIAAGDGVQHFLRLAEATCPSGPVTLSALAVELTPWERLVCLRDGPITIEGTYGCDACMESTPGISPGWLADVGLHAPIAGQYSYYPFVRVAIPEGINVPSSRDIVQATLRVDNSGSATCSYLPEPDGTARTPDPMAVELFCRERLVLESFEVIGTDDFPGG